MLKKYLFFLLLLLIPISTNALSNTARSSIVMDMNTKRILYENNAYEQRSVASISKLMTALLTIENTNLSDTVTVGEEVLPIYGTNIYISVGEKISVKDLLYGLLLRSGNDAAVVLANYVSKNEEEFVKLMNKKAKEIGMKDTKFINSHGLDDDSNGNISTAYDMALLSSYINKYDIYKEISGTKKYKTKTNEKSYVWYNRNKLLSKYEFATGGKNGYTPKAGRTLVTTSSKDTLDLTCITLKDDNEYDTHVSLYEYIYQNYKNYKFIDNKDFMVEDNTKDEQLYIKKSFSYPMSKKEYENSKVVLTLDTNKKYKNNDKIGVVKVLLKDEVLFSEDVYVKIPNKTNLFTRIKNWFLKIFN